MAERKKAGCLASLGQPASATNILAWREHPFSIACNPAANGGERMAYNRPQYPTAPLVEEGPLVEPTPDPNHPLVAYPGPSLARAGTVG